MSDSDSSKPSKQIGFNNMFNFCKTLFFSHDKTHVILAKKHRLKLVSKLTNNHLMLFTKSTAFLDT